MSGKPVNLPLNLPVNQSINTSMQNSPIHTGKQQPRNQFTEEAKPRNSLSHAVLTLPQVGHQFGGGRNNGIHSGHGLTQIETEHKLQGNLGTSTQSYTSLSAKNSKKLAQTQNQQNQVTAAAQTSNHGNYQLGQVDGQQIEGVNSAASLWGPDDEVGSKMQAKLPSDQLDGTAINTQKLKDITR